MHRETRSPVDEVHVSAVFVIVKRGEVLLERSRWGPGELCLHVQVLERRQRFVLLQKSACLQGTPCRHQFPNDPTVVVRL